MALHLHRSNRVEALVEMLCAQLTASWPADPFQRVPIVVGSSGMERFLRHDIATRIGIASGLAFPFPRPAFLGAATWLLSGATDPHAEFWEVDAGEAKNAARFEREAMAFRLIELLRSHGTTPAFEHVERYLAEGAANQDAGRPVTGRELMFARDVADVLDRLMHDRPIDALAWARDPSSTEPTHVWLATLLRQLGAASDMLSPAAQFESLCANTFPDTRRVLCVFGLSTLGPGDRERLAQIARGIDVHLFVLVPTREWVGDLRTRSETRQALRRAKTPEAVAQIESEQRHANPIVAALGAPSRDLQNWFEEAGYHHDDQVFETSDALDLTLLARMHQWMLVAQGTGDVTEPWPVDNSVQFHSTYGALRQCEVLRDRLLLLFAQDVTLEPRDVLVMTPDIEAYASLVAAVLARRGGDDVSKLPAIATSIADLGLSRTNPMAEVMLALLELATERVTATRVSSLLSLTAVRTRFDIDDDELGTLQHLLRESGLRWGLDADDRARVDQPRRDQNTVRFAVERVALGVLMPDEDALGVVVGKRQDLGPAVPLDALGSDAVDRAGALVALLNAIAVHRAALIGPWSASEWRQRLLDALDAVAEAPDAIAWLRAEVVSALDQFVEHAVPLGELTIEREALCKWLSGHFELAQRGDRPITGAVTVCALQPMRSVPFRVVALIGMDDGAFPRGSRSRNWDPFEQRRAGERDGREIDRHLLLEAILSSREHLIVLWSGHEVQTGKDQAAAVPVEELLETLGALTRQNRTELVREHPLQPWSEKSFLPQATTYDTALARAATSRRQLRTKTTTEPEAGLFGLRTTLLPEETEPLREVTIDDLVNALYKPQKYFLRQRLGLWLETDATTIEDREPLDLEQIEGDRKITERVFEGLRDVNRGTTAPETDEHVVIAQIAKRLAGEGALPLRAGGSRVLAAHARVAAAVLHHIDQVAGERHEPLSLVWASSDGLRIVGQATDVRALGGHLLLQSSTLYGDGGAYGRLKAWLQLLVAVAAGHPVVGARVVGPDASGKTKRAVGSFVALSANVANHKTLAQTLLDDLVLILRRARRTGLPLFRRTSPVVAAALLNDERGKQSIGARVKLQTAVSEAWHGRGSNGAGDSDDPWIATLFGDYTPVDDLGPGPDGVVDLAARVWLPVARAQLDGKVVAERFKFSGYETDSSYAEDAE